MKLPRRSVDKIKTGFTFIEVAIVIGILGIIFAIGLPVTLDFYFNYQLNSERDSFVILLRRARSMSLTNQDQNDHGVFISSGDYLIFTGQNFSSRDQSKDQSFPRAIAVTVASSSPEIAFKSLSARSSSTTINFIYNLKKLPVYVNQEGNIDW